jgi:predicted DsbA family dithiol-disulfide isomerase
LDEAIQELASERPDVQVNVTWKPFLLRPNMPEDGMQKPPATPDNPRVGARLKAAGENAGVNFTGLTDRAPNSIQVHALLKYYEDQNSNLQHELMEILFRHYFTDGKYPNLNNLNEALNECQAPNIDQAIEYIQSDENKLNIRKEALSYSQSGVSGVPFFIFNNKPAFSGAQPPSVIKSSILNAI